MVRGRKSTNPKRYLKFLWLFILLAGCAPKREDRIETHIGLGSISKNALDDFLDSKMEKLKIPGLSVAVINDGKIVYQKTLGYANVEEKLPVTTETIFEGASLSKSVFAFFVMGYVEEGKLSLDKPLYEYLPYADIDYDDRYKKITARMVLSHRSGFPNWRRDEADGKLKIKFEPGTQYFYSGEGYQYLAMVLRQIEGTDWNGLETAFQERVGKLLGFEHTVFIQTPYTKKNKAQPYNENGERINANENDEFGAAYSIHSEPVDFSKWMIAVMRQEQLSAKSYAELLKPHATVPSEVFDVSYCLGFFTPHFPVIETNIYFHTGNNDGFTCWYALDVVKDWGFVLFTNSQFGEALGEALFFYLLLGPYSPVIGIVILLVVLIGFGVLIRWAIRKMKNKHRVGFQVKS